MHSSVVESNCLNLAFYAIFIVIVVVVIVAVFVVRRIHGQPIPGGDVLKSNQSSSTIVQLNHLAVRIGRSNTNANMNNVIEDKFIMHT
jgi:hypothetical protein